MRFCNISEHAYCVRMGALSTAQLTSDGFVRSLFEREVFREKL